MYAAKNYYQCVWQLLPCETYRDCTILMFSDTFRKNVFNIPDTFDVNIHLLSIRKAGRRKWKMVSRYDPLGEAQNLVELCPNLVLMVVYAQGQDSPGSNVPQELKCRQV